MSNNYNNRDSSNSSSPRLFHSLIQKVASCVVHLAALVNVIPQRDRYDVSFWTMVSALANGFSILLSIGALIFVGLQLKATVEANKDNNKSFVTANRAWISTKEAAFQKDATGKYTFKMIYENSGNTPALDQNLYISFQNVKPYTMENGDAREWIEAHNPCAAVKPEKYLGVTFPKTPVTFAYVVSDDVRAKATVDEFDKGGSVMLINVCNTYRTFEQTHSTRTCYYFWPGKSQDSNLPRCLAGQDAN